VDCLVTDPAADPEFLESLRKQGVDVAVS
jgi:hypothetical protein